MVAMPVVRVMLAVSLCAVVLSAPTQASPTDELAPAPPWALRASAADEGIHLQWQAPLVNGSASVELYRVYRGEGGPLQLIAEVVATEYLDADAENDTFYAYAVTAVSTAGESPPTAEAWTTYPRCQPVYPISSVPFVEADTSCFFPLPISNPPGAIGCPTLPVAGLRDLVCENPVFQTL